jgi:3'(2'), 5'-bisphosphate nucleotidase
MNGSSEAMRGHAELVQALIAMAERAGGEILSVYESAFRVQSKDDASPVTDADTRAERVILEALAAAAPGIPVVAEESVAAGKLPDISGGRFFLVDPLDGTREFISRNGEFTVNVALVEGARPVLGVVHLPALAATYWSDGTRAWRRRGAEQAIAIACRRPPDDGLVVVASRSHRDARTDEFLAGQQVKQLISAGSSLKLCRVAEGSADLYPRLGRTMEWDIAAGQAVLEAAGGSVRTLDGTPLRYGKPGLDNPDFVARGLPQENSK